MSKTTRTTLFCLALVLALVGPAIAQEEMEIRKGRIMFANNDTIIVQVTEGSDPGMHKFNVKEAEGVQILDRNGNQIQFADLRKGEILTEVRIHHPSTSRTTVTQAEVEEHVTKAAAAAPAAAASSSMSSDGSASSGSMPSTLPKTASPLPLVGVIALALLVLAATLRTRRLGRE